MSSDIRLSESPLPWISTDDAKDLLNNLGGIQHSLQSPLVNIPGFVCPVPKLNYVLPPACSTRRSPDMREGPRPGC